MFEHRQFVVKRFGQKRRMLSVAKFSLHFKWGPFGIANECGTSNLLARRLLMIPCDGCRYKRKSDGRLGVRFAHWSGRPTMEGVEMKKLLFTPICLAAVASAATVQAQATSSMVTENGVTYRETRQVVQKSIPVTEYQTREQKVYRPQVSTQYQSYQQTYYTPVTQYQYVPRLRGQWNPFMPPYWTHELHPTTHWEARPATVQVPVARTDWVEETRTSQVPVTTYRTVPEEYTSRVAVSVAPGGVDTNVASRPVQIGGQQLTKDPPAQPSPYSKRY